MMTKNWEMTETLTNGFSSHSTQHDLSSEYQHDRAKMIFIFVTLFCVLDEGNLDIRRLKCTLKLNNTEQ